MLSTTATNPADAFTPASPGFDAFSQAVTTIHDLRNFGGSSATPLEQSKPSCNR